MQVRLGLPSNDHYSRLNREFTEASAPVSGLFRVLQCGGRRPPAEVEQSQIEPLSGLSLQQPATVVGRSSVNFHR
jgi:hypothetical protein